MATLRQFQLSMNQLATRIEKRGPEVQRLCALEILRLVIMGTPVGNKQIWMEPGKARVGYVGGRARANWFVGINGANTTITNGTDASGSRALSEGDTAIKAASPGQSIHLCNNLPYIVPLNQGHSHQAPSGWIDRGVQQGIAILSTEKVTTENKTP